jgi:hypothetical protein
MNRPDDLSFSAGPFGAPPSNTRRVASRPGEIATWSMRVRRISNVCTPIPPSMPPAIVSVEGGRVAAPPYAREILNVGEASNWQPMSRALGIFSLV